jgi:hypothetical protein
VAKSGRSLGMGQLEGLDDAAQLFSGSAGVVAVRNSKWAWLLLGWCFGQRGVGCGEKADGV